MYIINKSKMFYDMADGQAIVINFETGMYYGMSSLGSYVIDYLLKGASLEKLADALRKEKECPQDILERLQAFVSALAEKEIILEAEGKPNQETNIVFGDDAYVDGYDLDVNEFAEAQDLIMADPIHDVDADMGWPIMKE